MTIDDFDLTTIGDKFDESNSLQASAYNEEDHDDGHDDGHHDHIDDHIDDFIDDVAQLQG